jgi:hypothetical protein
MHFSSCVVCVIWLLRCGYVIADFYSAAYMQLGILICNFSTTSEGMSCLGMMSEMEKETCISIECSNSITYPLDSTNNSKHVGSISCACFILCL